MDGNTLILLGLALTLGGGTSFAILTGRRCDAMKRGRIPLAIVAGIATIAGIASGATGSKINRDGARADVAALCAELDIKSERPRETCLRLVARNLP